MTEKSKETIGKSRRLRERIGLKLPIRVQGRDSIDHQWSEMSRLVDLTPLGARFSLKRPTEAGRLLLLTMAMPRQLRCFDHTEDQYRVWSLVRNISLVDPNKEGVLMEVGAAFVGKRPPQSFEIDPARRYEIAKPSVSRSSAGGPNAQGGLWTITEEAAELLTEIKETDKRKETRHSIPVDVVVEVFDEKGGLSLSEKTVTENISPQGAAIFTSLSLSPGRFVKVSSDQYNASLPAVVRAQRKGADGITRLHLEFVGRLWPL